MKKKLGVTISRFHLDDWDCVDSIIKLYYTLYNDRVKFYMDDRSDFDPPEYDRHKYTGRLIKRRVNFGILSCVYELDVPEEYVKEQVYILKTLAEIVNNKLKYFSYNISHF